MQDIASIERQSNMAIGIILIVVFAMLAVVTNRNRVIEQQQETITYLQAENDYLNGHYQEKFGYVIGEYGDRQYIRLVSIDGGRNWFEVTPGREVLQPPYFHQRYPDMQLTEIPIIKDYESKRTRSYLAGR